MFNINIIQFFIIFFSLFFALLMELADIKLPYHNLHIDFVLLVFLYWIWHRLETSWIYVAALLGNCFDLISHRILGLTAFALSSTVMFALLFNRQFEKNVIVKAMIMILSVSLYRIILFFSIPIYEQQGFWLSIVCNVMLFILIYILLNNTKKYLNR